MSEPFKTRTIPLGVDIQRQAKPVSEFVHNPCPAPHHNFCVARPMLKDAADFVEHLRHRQYYTRTVQYTVSSPPSSLTPDLIGNLSHKSQLLLLILLSQGISALVGAEPTLWADSNPLQSLLTRLTASLRDEVGRLEYPLLDLVLVLQFAELGADGTDDDILILGEELERLEATRTGRIVLKIESVHLEVGEELLGDDVVCTLGEVAATNEVAAAQMDACVEVCGQLADAVVVEANVGV